MGRSRGGKLRLYVEEDSLAPLKSNIGAVALPLLSLGRGMKQFPLPRLSCKISIDPTDPVAFLPVLWGWLPFMIGRDTFNTLADAFAFTPWVDVPQSSVLIGAKLHFEVLVVIVAPGNERIRSVTNSLEITLR